MALDPIKAALESFAQRVLKLPPRDGAFMVAAPGDLVADVEANKDALTTQAMGSYDSVGTFITAMLPYGSEVVFFPNVDFNAATDDPSPDKMYTERGIQIAGLHRARTAADPDQFSSSLEMTVKEEHECFYWDFRFPDDPSLAADKSGDMQNLQVTKAIRIPFVYRRPGDKKLLTGALLIGFEGSGDG
jgi:hypothetical protein